MPDLPIGTVTFLFTDVEGSVRLWEAWPSEMRAALARHDSLVEEHVEGHGGVLVKARGEGDSCFAVFGKASDALAAALAIQLALLSEPWPTPDPLRVRMALHTGEADLREGDYHGSAVNRCARLRAIAHGGQVLVSHSTYDLVRDALPRGASLRDLGEQRLRDLARPEPVLQLLHPDLPADFPALHTLDAYPNNLPLQLTSFVGREREMAEVRRLLGTTRLLTLTGTGGCGKTRLAYQVAADLLDEYPDGVWLVELASLSDPSLMAQTVAFALGVREALGQSILTTLLAHLKPRRLLLVLDNCEHLLDPSARLADALLRGCPHLWILATSREALGISGETSYRVPSLSLPYPRAQASSLASLSQYEAVRLFVDRAVAVLPSFAVTDQNAASVAQVCWRLDGIPLAIELAAARVRGLTVEQVAARLDDRFKLLTGGSRTALRRQQTLRATIDWSYDLLSLPERVLLRRLAVFVGGFSLEAAEAVCQGGEVESGDVLELLLHLVDRSLVLASVHGAVERYDLLETIHQYAQERLFESGEVAEVRDRHLEWYLAFAERMVPRTRLGEELLSRLEAAQLELEHDNLRAALDWSLTRDEDAATAVRLAVPLGAFWSTTGRASERRGRLASVLARPGGDPKVRVAVLRYAALGESRTGHWQEARELSEQALALAQEIGDRGLIALSLLDVSLAASDRGDYSEVRPLREEALRIAREVGDRWIIARILLQLSMLLSIQGDSGAARPLAEEGLAIRRALGDSSEIVLQMLILGRIVLWEGDLSRARALAEEALASAKEDASAFLTSFCLGFLGDLARAEGNYAEAAVFYRDALATFRRLTAAGERLLTPHFVLRVAGVWAAEGRAREATRLYGAVRGWLESVGLPVPWGAPGSYRQDEASAWGMLGEEAFARAWSEGQAMTLDEAVECALGDEEWVAAVGNESDVPGLLPGEPCPLRLGGNRRLHRE